MDGADDVLPADRTFAHALPTLSASDHVTTLQQDTVDHSVHADPAQVFIIKQLASAPIWKEK